MILNIDKQITKLRKNIHISKYISANKITYSILMRDIQMLRHKYGDEVVELACNELARRNAPITNLKGILIAYINTILKKRKVNHCNG